MHHLFPRWPRLDVIALVLRSGTEATLKPGQYFLETPKAWRRLWLDGKGARMTWRKKDVREVIERE